MVCKFNQKDKIQIGTNLNKYEKIYKEELKMNLYDSIKNSMEDNKKIKQLIDFYTESEDPKREIYNKLVSATESRDFDKEKYIKDYETLIVKPTMEALYRNIEKRINLNEDVFGKNSLILKNVFKECSTYEELEKKIESTFDEKRKNALKKCSWVLNTPKGNFDEYNLTGDQLGWYEEAKEFFSDEEIYSLAPFVELKRRMEQYLQVSEDVMGFHVNSEKKMDLDRNNERNDLKFYINAGDDTCKVASYFRDKCETRNMNYYFKVVNPHKDDLNRSDKLCIYSELKDIQDYLGILQEIRKENPEFIFEQPPMMVGNFENWIGVSTDYSGDKYDCPKSYNEAMSNICLKALDKVCKENKIGSSNNEKMNITEQLKEEIVLQAQKIGYSKDKVCIKNSIKRTLQKMDLNSTKNKEKMLKIQNIKTGIKNSKISILEIKNIIDRVKLKIVDKLKKHKKQGKKTENKIDIPMEQIKYPDDGLEK